MKITILGSGGGEGFPSAFCSCDHCNAARIAGGKSIRTLSQTLINDDLLIDLPADTAHHANASKLSLGTVENIIITHTHLDHFYPQLLGVRGSCYSHNMRSTDIMLWGSSDVRRVLDGVFAMYGMDDTVVKTIYTTEIPAYETKTVGKYEVTALAAKHAPTLIPLNYVIREGDKTLLYFLDTGYPEEKTLKFLKDNFGHFDAVIMDSTMGTIVNNVFHGHMTFADVKRLKAEIISLGLADEKTVFVADHITHNNAETHDKVEEIFEGSGITVAYDGMCFEI